MSCLIQKLFIVCSIYKIIHLFCICQQIIEGPETPDRDIGVLYYKRAKCLWMMGTRGKCLWVMGTKEFTIIKDDISEYIEKPKEKKMGSRTYYEFTGTYLTPRLHEI